MSMKPTMVDVARRAGVSPSTASRAIHNSGYVAEENRQAIIQAAKELGYRPNLQARSLRTNKSSSLGLVVSSSWENPFFSNISHAVRVAAANAGYALLTLDHSYSSKTEKSGIDHFVQHSVDGVILCHAYNPENYAELASTNVPIVEIERFAIPDAHQIRIDPEPGIFRAVQALSALGHERITFIGGSVPTGLESDRTGEAERMREGAFRAAIARHSLDPEQCPFMSTNYVTHLERQTYDFEIARRLLSDKNASPTAIIAGSDLFAARILQVFYQVGIRVPDDISLISFDDTVSHLLSPPLTSIAQPYEEIGKLAVEMITRALSRRTDAAVDREDVKTRLVERASLGRFKERNR